MAAASVLAVTAVPGAAQSTYSASRLLESIDDTSLIATLDAMDVAHETQAIDDGTSLISMEFDSGFEAFSYTRACDSQCLGLVLVGEFSPPDGMKSAKLLTIAGEFNDNYPAGKLYLADNGKLYIQSYVIFDGGITMENLRTQIAVFGELGATVSEMIRADD